MTTTTRETDPSFESDLLGAILAADPEAHGAAVAAALEMVRDHDFADVVLRRLWSAARAAWESRGRIDVAELRAATDAPADLLVGLAERAIEGTSIDGAARRVALSAVERSEIDAARRLATGADADRNLARLELSYLAERRSELERAEATAPTTWDAADEIDKPLESVDEFIERMLVRPGIAIAFGPPSSGKSYAVLAACFDAVMGGGCFAGVESLQIRPSDGRYSERDRVLWVFGSEDTPRRMRARLKQMLAFGPHRGKTLPPGVFTFGKLPNGVMLNTPRGLAWLRAEIIRRKATIVALDTVASVCGDSLEVEDNGAVCSFMMRMHRLRDEFGLVIWLLHHTRKGSSDPKAQSASKADAALGAGQWRAQTDTMVGLEAIDGNTSLVTLRVVKAKDIDVVPPAIRLTQEPQSARFSELRDDEEPPERVAAPRGRRSVDVVAAVLGLRKDHPDGVSWATAGPDAGISRSVWYERREEAQVALLALGHTVVGGVLRWGARG